ncbi:MAG TPA: TadE/TadG family type IV pilus assembly protein [Candidatus Dormibacteraeota bacterium]|nr:TadE/TadG family type IV pilus assembly protein [Candidatus Dormibacteraeota bacterium]
MAPRYHRGPSMARAFSISSRKRSRGQAMVEFAIVAPVLFFLLLGVFESGLLLFVVGTARFSSGDAARQESESGNAANADQVSIAVIRNGAMGTTTLATIRQIDIFKLNEDFFTGALTPACNAGVTSPPAPCAGTYNTYKLDGTTTDGGPVRWLPASRSVKNRATDFLGVRIWYQYNWKTGVFLASSPVQLNMEFDIRLEPQTY